MKSILNISCENWDLKERVRVSGLGLGQGILHNMKSIMLTEI